MNESRLDIAVRRYREDPSELNRRRLEMAQQDHARAFMVRRGDEYIRRSK